MMRGELMAKVGMLILLATFFGGVCVAQQRLRLRVRPRTERKAVSATAPLQPQASNERR